jgi:hypothetical protein
VHGFFTLEPNTVVISQPGVVPCTGKGRTGKDPLHLRSHIVSDKFRNLMRGSIELCLDQCLRIQEL